MFLFCSFEGAVRTENIRNVTRKRTENDAPGPFGRSLGCLWGVPGGPGDGAPKRMGYRTSFWVPPGSPLGSLGRPLGRLWRRLGRLWVTFGIDFVALGSILVSWERFFHDFFSTLILYAFLDGFGTGVGIDFRSFLNINRDVWRCLFSICQFV